LTKHNESPDYMPAVLMPGVIPGEFVCPPAALRSGCSSLLAVVSGFDNLAVEYIRGLLSDNEPPDLRLVLLVHATCPTNEKNLCDLLALSNARCLTAWVLPVCVWGQRCSWVLALRRSSPAHVLWTSSADDFGLREPAIDEAHLVIESDPLVVDQFVSWFSRLSAAAAPLTAETARIPTLVRPRGTQDGAAIWDQYVAYCRAMAAGTAVISAIQLESPPTASLDPSQALAGTSAEMIEREIREQLKLPKPDPLLQPLTYLFEQGDLVTIDRGSRIPPLEVPIKAKWFEIPGFREVGVFSHEVRFKISILDEKTNKALEARRKGTTDLLEKFSFPLAEGLRWMPHKAKSLFEAELKGREEEGKMFLGSIVSGTIEDWVESKRDLVSRDANLQYAEFHPGKCMPDKTINEILKELTGRFRRATSGNFLPKVSFVRTSFHLGDHCEQVSEWAGARTLLMAIAEYPRTALKSRAYFFRGLKVAENDLLNSMNVAEDCLVPCWFEPRSLDIALAELDVLERISECEHSDHRKCQLILDLLHRGRSLDDIQNSANNGVM
jgi:hypothetical protein